MQRRLSILNAAGAGNTLPPLIVQPGATGTPIPLIRFKF
jgi:hypothetical protein